MFLYSASSAFNTCN